MAWLIVLLALLATPRLAMADHPLGPAEAFGASERGEMTIVDVRLPAEWAETGLPEGAEGVPLQNAITGGLRAGFAADVLEAVGGDVSAPIALICARGNRSAFAMKLLRAEGFSDVHDISEGMLGSAAGPGWLARELPVEPCSAC